ncbi:hypothetical protein EPKpNR5180_28150 [Klebsiella pneumoniae]
MQRLAARRLHATSGSQAQFLVIAPLVAVLLMAVLPNLQADVPAAETAAGPRRYGFRLFRTYGGLLHPDGLFYRIVHISR